MSLYDIIGDIHGHARELTELLVKLGYVRGRDGYWHPEGRKVIFLGDFIDRGTENRAVLDIVRPMVEEGNALAVMGNHEYNAICYHTLHPETGAPLRRRGPKSFKQHERFLAEYPVDTRETRAMIDWFRRLPLYLELEGGARIIHACWHEPTIERLQAEHGLCSRNRLDDAFLFRSAEEGTSERAAIEILLKGPEFELPNGTSFEDKDGNPRHHVRMKWWLRQLQTYRAIGDLSDEQRLQLPDEPLPLTDCYWYPDDAPPVFFGHYWRRAHDNPFRHNALCLDLSAGLGGHLAAYRLNGEATIVGTNLVMVRAS